VIIKVFDWLPCLDYQLLPVTLAAEAELLVPPESNFFILLACEPGTTARRNHMMPKLGQILKQLKSNENMLDVFSRLQEMMIKQNPDQVPVKVYTCTKKICLNNIYANMQNASKD